MPERPRGNASSLSSMEPLERCVRSNRRQRADSTKKKYVQVTQLDRPLPPGEGRGEGLLDLCATLRALPAAGIRVERREACDQPRCLRDHEAMARRSVREPLALLPSTSSAFFASSFASSRETKKSRERRWWLRSNNSRRHLLTLRSRPTHHPRSGVNRTLNKDPHLLQLLQPVADLAGLLEVEVLGGFLHFLGQAGDGLVEILVFAEERLAAADGGADVEVVEIRQLHQVAVDGLDDRGWLDPMLLVVGLLDCPPAIRLADGILQRVGHHVGIEDGHAVQVPRGTPDGMDERGRGP